MTPAILFLEPKGTVLEVIRAAKARGFAPIALVSDPSLLRSVPNPYRSAVADIAKVIEIPSWKDQDHLRGVVDALANRFKIAGVYSGVDPCMESSAVLRTRFGLPTPSLEAMVTVLNKFLLRKKLRDLGLSKLSHYLGREVQQWKSWQFNGPAYFKPIHGAFSAYVAKCASLEEAIAAKESFLRGNESDPLYVKNYLRSQNEYHLEEAIEGELLSVEAISTVGEFRVLGLLSRILYSKNPIVEMGSCFPYPHPLYQKIVDTVRGRARKIRSEQVR